MAETAGVGGTGRTGLRMSNLDPLNGGDPNSIGGLSTKELLERLIKMQNPQMQGGQQAGGPQGSGGTQGAQGAGAGGGGQFSLEELLKELSRRAQLNQDEMANQLRQVRNAQPGQPTQQNAGQTNGLTHQLIAAAPIDVGANLNIQGGGGFSGGGFA